jgi:Flp pilus assembly protein TadD
LTLKGNFTASIGEFQQAIQALGRDGWILGPMGYALARAGRKAEAANIAREIESAGGSPVSFAYVYAALGDKPRALDALERAYAQPSWTSTSLLRIPCWPACAPSPASSP